MNDEFCYCGAELMTYEEVENGECPDCRNNRWSSVKADCECGQPLISRNDHYTGKCTWCRNSPEVSDR